MTTARDAHGNRVVPALLHDSRDIGIGSQRRHDAHCPAATHPPRPILRVDVASDQATAADDIPSADLAPAGYVTDACIAGDHYPNDAGTACYYCGLPAEILADDDPVTLYAFTYYSDDAYAERDRAQEARAGAHDLRRDRVARRPDAPGLPLLADPGQIMRDADRWHANQYRAARAERDAVRQAHEDYTP